MIDFDYREFKYDTSKLFVAFRLIGLRVGVNFVSVSQAPMCFRETISLFMENNALLMQNRKILPGDYLYTKYIEIGVNPIELVWRHILASQSVVRG